MSYSKQHIGEAISILGQLDVDIIEKAVTLLASTRERGGRLFILGVGGSAGNASHAEAFQAVVWHLFVSHPALKVRETKWESTK